MAMLTMLRGIKTCSVVAICTVSLGEERAPNQRSVRGMNLALLLHLTNSRLTRLSSQALPPD